MKKVKSKKQKRKQTPQKRKQTPKGKRQTRETGSAFSRAIGESVARRKKLYRKYNAPKKALKYTEYSARYLKKGKLPIPPSYTYKAKYTVTRHWQFYGPYAWQAMERVLSILRTDDNVQVVMVEFSTGYSKEAERVGTSWTTPIEVEMQVRVAVSRPSAQKVFQSSERVEAVSGRPEKGVFEEERVIKSASQFSAPATNHVFIDVYAKLYTLAAKRKFDL